MSSDGLWKFWIIYITFEEVLCEGGYISIESIDSVLCLFFPISKYVVTNIRTHPTLGQYMMQYRPKFGDIDVK